MVAYDVHQEVHRQLESIKLTPTHLYYFATPSISRRKSKLCARERFEEFNEFYIHGFLRLINAVMQRAPDGMAVFYPSTVFVQDRPSDMTEYAMSKAAGEILCTDIAKYFKKLRMVVERLPRLPTDQTASLIPVARVSSLPVMLSIVRKMHERSSVGDKVLTP